MNAPNLGRGRRANLFGSSAKGDEYLLDGDTSRRGHALARVKEIYAACGWRLDPAELPDHLAVVLDFAERGDDVQGQRLLETFQPGIDLLRAALYDCGSPYALVLDAVAATLPPPDEARREAARLAAAGPPRTSASTLDLTIAAVDYRHRQDAAAAVTFMAMDRNEAERLLDAHTKAREDLRRRAIDELRAAGGTLWQIGSFANGRPDAWSDLDLLVVGAPIPLGDPALLLDNPANGPLGGGYTGAAYLTGPLLVWIDWYTWPAGLPVPVESHLLAGEGPQGELPLAETLDHLGRGPAPTRSDQDEFTLAMIPIAAKYLARGNTEALTGMLTMLGGNTDTDPADGLRALLRTANAPALLNDRIARTIDVAEALSP